MTGKVLYCVSKIISGSGVYYYFILKVSKSDAGKRILPLHLLLNESELAIFRLYFQTINAGVLRKRDHLVQSFIKTADGKSLLDHHISTEIKKVLDENGLTSQTAHSLRHGFASALLCAIWLRQSAVRHSESKTTPSACWARKAIEQFGRADVEGRALTYIDDIRRLMGHSSIEVTFEQYIHVFDLITADAV